MSRLCIIGAGGHGKVIADCAKLMNRWDEIFFLDNKVDPGLAIEGCLVEGTIDCLPTLAIDDVEVVVALGDNTLRLRLFNECVNWQLAMATIIHPSAVISESVTIGAGTMICAGAIINPNATIGRSCIINTGASVDHDCQLADGVHIAPQAVLAGKVTVGEGSWVGMNAAVREGTYIGKNVIVGMNAAVIDAIPDNVTVVGVPAKVMMAETN